MNYPTTIRSGCVVAFHDKDMIEEMLPGATRFTYKNTELIAVKHTDESTLILRNSGYNVTPPISFSYNWPGPFTPYQHQLETAGAMSVYPRLHVFDDPGLGKSASCIWACDYLMKQGKVKKVLLVVPLSTMRATWDKELLQLVPHRSCSILYGSKTKRLKNLAYDCDFYIINHHGLKVIPDELQAMGFDLIVFDESTALKNSKTIIWKTVRKLSENCRLWLMTGTPTPNSPLDAFGQGRLVAPERLPPNFTRWREKVMLSVSRFKWVPKIDAWKHVNYALQPAVRHSKDECLDLPPVTYTFREAEDTPDQKRALKELNTKAQSDVGDATVTAVNAAALISKALQISQGEVINDTGGTTRIPAKGRLKVLKECIDQTSRKVIVFVNFTAVLDMIEDFLKKEGIGMVRVDGKITDKQREKNFKAFREDSDVKVLIAHPQTAAHGITLVEADTTIWYGAIYNAEYYEQANNRMNRPGQHHPMTVVHIYSSTFEMQIYKHLQGKIDFQDAVLSAVETFMN